MERKGQVRMTLGFLYLDWEGGDTTILGNSGGGTRSEGWNCIFSFRYVESAIIISSNDNRYVSGSVMSMLPLVFLILTGRYYNCSHSTHEKTEALSGQVACSWL